MLIACIQTDVVFADLSANLTRVLNALKKAGESKADLVVFPECVLCGYSFDSRQEALQHAISIDSPILTAIAGAARQHHLNVVLGFLEVDGDRLFNSSALIGSNGVIGTSGAESTYGVIGHYRKVHLPHLGVDRFVDRGDFPYRVVDSGGTKIGLAICYDCSFPEPMRVLGLEGADVIALSTNWPIGAVRTAEIVPPARSMENHLFFVAANRVGTERGFEFCGRSSICGPDGIVLAASNDNQETILFAKIDPEQARNKRIERTPGKHVIHRMNDRRPEFYERIARPN